MAGCAPAACAARTHAPQQLTGDRGRAEDLLQTAFLTTYRHWRRLDDQQDPVGYVRRVLVTTHLNWARRRSSTDSVLAELPDAGARRRSGRR